MVQTGSAVIDNRIAVEALTQLFNRIRKEVLTNMIVPAIVIMVMWSQVSHELLVAWGVMMLIGIWVNYFIAVAYFKQQEPINEPLKWGRRMSAVMLYFGLLWVYAISLFFVEDSVGHQVFLSTIVIIFSLGSIMVGLYWLPMFYLLAVPIFSALAVRFIMQGTFEYISLAILLLWTLVMSWFMAKMLNKTVWSEMRLRHKSNGLVDELNIKTADAERANIAKSKFLAAASHDLRQPLHALMLNATVLEERNKDTGDTPVINNIISSVRSMEGLFNSLLDISKLDAGVVTPDNIHFNVQTVLDKIKIDCQSLAKVKKLHLDIPSTDIYLYSDPALLERVLRNLIFNAIHYTENGRVTLAMRTDAEIARFEIIDTGVGIKEDEVDSIFDEFIQLDNPERDRGKGLGLGLSIVKRLIHLMNSTIVVESSPGKGSVFSFSIPLGNEKLVTRKIKESIKLNLNPLNHFVVVIDDEKSIREGLSTLLESWNCTVKAFSSAKEAVDYLGHYEYPPDALLVDYRLRKNRTGLEAIADINKCFGENIPALIVTGDTDTDRLKEAEEHGYHLLHKPLQPSQLRVFLQNITQ